jgi:DNA polymerase elongation subunit (family B)
MSDVECFNYPRPDNIRLEDNNKPLRFQIVDFFVPENDRSRRELNRIPEKREEINYNEDPPEYTVRLFGSTLEGYSVSAEITGYKPYFYIKVPDTIIKNIKKSNNKNGLKALSQDFKNYLLFESYTNRYNKKTKIISNYYRNHLVSVRTEIKKEFMGFTNNEDFYFLKIKVKSQKLFNTLKYFFNDPPEEFFERWGNEIFRLYESNIDPMLRFIHDKNILPCGWVEIPAKMYSILANSCDDDSYCRTTFTVEADHNYLKPLSVNSTAPITIVSFDIECTSSHGDFPVAIKDYGKLAKDLITISKNIRYTKEELIKWIMDAYSKEIVITGDCKIHRLYTINKVNLEQVERKLRYIMDDIISLMKETSNITYDDEENEESPVDKKKDIYYETVIKNKLTWKNKDSKLPYLPKLQGDAIIQIGTTVHKYGSDEIIYKNIISLNSCSKIPGTEVQHYKTEAEVLKAWKNLIIMLDPDILMGYNIFGFDMPYIWERSQELDIEDYGIGFGRYGERECVLYEQNLSSAALGDNILRYFDLDGVVLVDMYKVMQRTPLDSYKLDFVAQLYLGDKKDDLKPYEIFERFKGNADDRKVIAEYCIQDCALVNRLFHKLKVLENNNAMGNVCLVPLSYLFMRGQGVKIFSLVAQFCKNENHAIPVLRNYGDEEIVEDESGYEGAIVLNPMEGMYLEDAITVLDYSSLYPSSMIERNLSHDCYVNNPKYDNIPGVNYVTVTYDIYEGVGDKKTKVAENKSKFVQLPNNEKGIIPRILMKLLTQRKNTRKKMEYETITLKDGNKFSGLITKKDNGENVITDFDLKESWSFKDEDIVSREETYNNFEKDVFDALQLAYKVTANSLYGQIGSRVSPIYLKDIAACTTATGRERIMMAKEYVEKNYDATVIYGDSVMPYTPITLKRNNEIIITTFEEIEGDWKSYEEFKPFDTNRTDKEQINPIDMEVWTPNGWSKIKRIIKHKTTKKIYRVLTHTGLVDVTEDHSLLDINGEKIKPNECTVGTELLHSQPDIKKDYILNNDNIFDNTRGDEELYIDTKNQLTAQTYVILLQRLGYNISINTRKDKPNIYRITYTFSNQRKSPNKIKKLELLHENYYGYVYDIETEEGIFHGGIGNLILKNTDSIFIKFNHQNGNGNPIKGRETLSLGIKAGQRASDDINKILPPPQNLEYEKTFFPFIIFSKKRYVGLLYEDDPNKKPKQKSMGIVLKRRDNAPIVKKIYGGIIDILLNKYDLNASVEFLQNELQKLINGEYPLEDLIITKTLKGNYKDRTKIAHCVLADRMGERDPGNKPQINDRIPYVYIKTEGEVKLQGDRIEFPEYIIDNNITPDYQFYITNQLMKPICQIFALCVEKLPNYPYGEDHWERWNEELKDNAIYSSSELKRKNRISALKEQEVENLLFSQFIDKKKRNTNLPSLKTKSTKKKQIVEHEISEDAPKLVQEIFDIKADKITKERASYCVDIKLYMNNEIVYTNIFKKPKSNKGIILNKIEFITQRMVVAIKEISKNKEYVSMIENKGLYLGVNKTYKNYLSKAIDALNNNTDMPFEEELKKAEEELDTEKLKELHIIQHTSILPGYLSNIKYKYI